MLLQDITLDEDGICFMHVIAISLIYFPRFFSLYWYMKCLKLGLKRIKVISQDSKLEKRTPYQCVFRAMLFAFYNYYSLLYLVKP